jgi:hypothetical protein
MFTRMKVYIIAGAILAILLYAAQSLSHYYSLTVVCSTINQYKQRACNELIGVTPPPLDKNSYGTSF